MCIRDSCCSDPKPIDCMYTPYATAFDGKLTYRIKKSDSVKNETVHHKANRLVQEISKMGEDLLECRIKLFVYKHNQQVDMRFGRVDATSIGTPIEELMINQLAAGVLSSAPFPLTLGRVPLQPIAKVSKQPSLFHLLLSHSHLLFICVPCLDSHVEGS